MMSKSQRYLYLDAARRAYERAFDPDDHTAPTLEEWRHDQVAAALGIPRRFRDFTNRDLDIVLGHFRKLATNHTNTTNSDGADSCASVPSVANSDAAIEAGECRRLLHVIRELRDALPTNYAATVLWQRFKLTFDEELDTLDLTTLRQIRATLHARQVALAAKQRSAA